jgi:hypothetical protein
LKAVQEEGQARLQLDFGAGSATVTQLTLRKEFGGPVKYEAHDRQVCVTCPLFEATADEVTFAGPDRLMLQGHVKFCQTAKHGARSEVVADRMGIGLRDGCLNLEVMQKTDSER